jgi:hypothetical protein
MAFHDPLPARADAPFLTGYASSNKSVRIQAAGCLKSTGSGGVSLHKHEPRAEKKQGKGDEAENAGTDQSEIDDEAFHFC